MTFRRSGLNPLAYMGVEPIPLSPDVAEPRDPTMNDINYNLLTRWLNTDNQFIWVLVNLNAGIATWVHLTTNIGPFPPGEINKVTTDDTLQVIADANNNINIFGAHGINTTGSANPFPNTVTVRVNNTLTLGDEADVGAAASLTLESGILEIVNGNAVIGNTDVGPLASEVIFEKSRAGGAINSGDDLGGIVFQGFDGTGYTTGAEIISESSGTVAAGRVASDLQFFTHPDSVVAATQRMVINSDGSVLINFPDAGGADALTVTGNIDVPNTNTAGTQGVIKYGGNRFITNFGTRNTFVGSLSGNTTVTGTDTVAFGTSSGNALTTGLFNSLLGSPAGPVLTTGSSNVAVGHESLLLATSATGNTGVGTFSLEALLTGSNNVAVGVNSGNAYVAAESNNVLLGNTGAAAENNTLRLGGATGAGAQQQDRAFIAGVNGVTLGAGFKAVTIDPATDQLGVATFPTPAPIQSAFNYYVAVNQANVTGDGTLYTIQFPVQLFDLNGDFDGVSTFTAPIDGIYSFSTAITLFGVAASRPQFFIGFYTGSGLQYDLFDANGNIANSGTGVLVNGTALIQLVAGDTLVVKVTVAGSVKNSTVAASLVDPSTIYVTWFAGHLVYAT